MEITTSKDAHEKINDSQLHHTINPHVSSALLRDYPCRQSRILLLRRAHAGRQLYPNRGLQYY